MNKKPEVGHTYWIPLLTSISELTRAYVWTDDYFDNLYFERGFVNNTREGAIEQSKSILSYLREK